MKNIMIFSYLILFMSCSVNKQDLVGSYAFKKQNVIDTLIIKNDIYIHKIYNKESKLMYHGEGEWNVENNRITLLKFFNNEDNELEDVLSSKDAEKFLMIASFPIYTQSDKMIIEVNSDENIFYNRVK